MEDITELGGFKIYAHGIGTVTPPKVDNEDDKEGDE
jgi:hypothetical protein